MNKKSIEDKFSIDMDAYFNGIEHTDEREEQEYNEILKLGKTLSDKDFSKDSNKEAVFKKTLNNINQHKGENVMKNSNKVRKITAAAASFVIVCGVFSQTSFAKGFAEKVINKISLGHITVEQSEGPSEMVVPTNLEGKVFDKNKNPVTVITKNTGKIYTKSGEQIVDIKNGKIVTISEKKAEEAKDEENIVTVKDSSSLNKYTCFNVKLPSYLPKGYKFDRAEFFKDEDGIINKKYINLYFTNEKTGKCISMQQRFADQETKYASGTDGKIEKVKVNGKDAVLSDNRSMDWENNGVLYGLSGRGAFGKDELIKIADSIK
ncbi:DUF4367 domain-containing protein [Clostridium sp. P21]|uniref:DUF4367 domain-containing protein n=1 Tax=Clostridium muellerianum TaxID=2716538 RepID=A0A7Y0HQ99_9CLOT|nr:DUF4367 domain-containing protein [Clostridium muellerianum]NMM64517.1 DUF4367 domain-containing protein [Clostridium muellerianum]